jgi:hypothetical protein
LCRQPRRAAEICVFEKDSSEESLLPREMLDNLGPVLNLLRGSIDPLRSTGSVISSA